MLADGPSMQPYMLGLGTPKQGTPGSGPPGSGRNPRGLLLFLVLVAVVVAGIVIYTSIHGTGYKKPTPASTTSVTTG